LARSSW